MNDQELSDTELFDQAVTEEGGDNADQKTDQQVDQAEQQQQAETQAASQDQQADNGQQQVDDNAPHIPSWRLREVNEERRQLAERVKALEAERQQWAAQQQRREPEKKPETDDGPDPLLDPKGYAKAVREEIRQEMLAERREESLQRAAKTYKDEFQSAYEMAQKHVDPALRARMQESRDPGETLMDWYREQKTRAEIGGDLVAYKQRLREEALKDPEFRKLAMEAWRNEGQQQPQNGRPKVDMPRMSPSLNGATRANAALRSEGTQDVSDRELWNEIAG